MTSDERNAHSEHRLHPHVALTGSGTVAEIAGAEARLPEVFAMLNTLLDGTLEHAMTSGVIGETDTALRFVHLKAWDRAFNTMKAIRLLMTQDFWELAQPLLRQLFELLVNLEEIDRADDREAAAAKFMKFGILQRARGVIAVVDYEALTGRVTDERMKLADVLREAGGPDQIAREFWPEGKNGKRRLQNSWCARTTRDLAIAGGPIRAGQYELVFRAASMEAHAAPGAVTAGTAHPTSTDELLASVDSDNGRIKETAALAITFFCEVWKHAEDVVEFPGELLLDAMADVMRVMGQPVPG